MLEELGVKYNVIPIDIREGEQNSADFLKICSNNKIPAIFDHETRVALMESGAILFYLAEKYKKLFGSSLQERVRIMEWLMWQMSGVGPIFGQVHHFCHFNPGVAEYAEERFKVETLRLYKVLDERLSGRHFICDQYSIADIATWPWISRYEWHEVDLSNFPNVRRWYKSVLKREEVQRGYHIPKKMGSIPQG